MPKRTNEESQSEPAAKRVANSSSHEDLLVEAQASLDRLDFKTTGVICSQIIDSDPTDVHKPLMMRSISLGKTNRPYEAVQDVERALDSKKSVETHLRAAFAYLGMVQHHLNLAKGHFVENSEPTTSLLSQNVIELEESIQDAKNLEKRGSFKRVSPELFIKIASFVDSPSLMKCARVSKQFNQSVLGEEELFRSFTMKGTSNEIARGLRVFAQKCNDRIHSVKLEMLDEIWYPSLTETLSRSVLTLRSIEVVHMGTFGQELLPIAHRCPSLKVFSSSRLDSRIGVAPPGFLHEINLSSWKPQQLETFIFTCGSFSLRCDDALNSILRHAKVVKISDSGIGQDFIFNLLSSTPSLVTVEFPLQRPPSEADDSVEMPTFNLPSLISLSLAAIPQGGFDDEDSSGKFLSNLDAPSLQHLSIADIAYLGSLSPLKSSQIRSLSLGVSNASDYLQPAIFLLEQIQGWESLQHLNIKAEGESSSELCNSLVSHLTPQSRENIQSRWRRILLFPQLASLSLSGEDESEIVVNLAGLASLVASRRAINERLPVETVLWSANGCSEACDEASPSAKTLAFESGTPQICSRMESIDVKQTARSSYLTEPSKTSVQWLMENLSRFDHPYLPSELVER